MLGALKQHQQPLSSAALDYGCGVGDLTAILSRTGYRAVGADISLPFVRSAEERHPSLPFVALGAGPTIPFGADRFWAVTAINTIEHVATPAQTLCELHRVLIPGGLLVMTFPNLTTPLRPLKRFPPRRRRARYGPESGDSVGQAIRLLARNSALLLGSRLSGQPQFRPRQPDFVNAERYRQLGYDTDYNAVWLCNPLDVALHLKGLGMHILQLRGIPRAAGRALSHDQPAAPRLAGGHLLPHSVGGPQDLLTHRRLACAPGETGGATVCQSLPSMLSSPHTAAALPRLRRCTAANLTKMTSAERLDFMQS